MTCILIIKGLPNNVQKTDILNRFIHGEELGIKIKPISDSKGNLTCEAKVKLNSEEQLKKCINVYNNSVWRGQVITLEQRIRNKKHYDTNLETSNKTLSVGETDNTAAKSDGQPMEISDPERPVGRPMKISDPMKKSGPMKVISKVEQHKASDSRRVEALDVLHNKSTTNKELIHNSLNQGSSLNKKIAFDSDEEEIHTKPLSTATSKSSLKNNISSKFNLFEEAEEDEETLEADDKRFGIKPQFSGKHGEKMLELQSKLSYDSRFTIDERFASDSEDDNDDNPDLCTKQPDSMADIDLAEERKKSLDILDSVIGKKHSTKNKNEKYLIKPMIRYDPDNEDHRRYVRTTSPPKQPIKDNVSKKIIKSNTNTDVSNTTNLNTDRYYSVKPSISEAFSSKEKGNVESSFNLTNLFNTTLGTEPSILPPDQDNLCSSNDKPSTKRKLDKTGIVSPPQSVKAKSKRFTADSAASDISKDKVKNFFYTTSNTIIKESLEFFRNRLTEEDIKNQWNREKSRFLLANRKRKGGYRTAASKQKVTTRRRKQQ